MEQAQGNASSTPGPWWVTDSGVRAVEGYVCHTIKATHYPGQDERYERETAERAANARLIAFAPDLLAALRPFAHWASGFGPHGREDSWVIAKTPTGKTLTMGDVRRAYAVVAKATGAAA